MEEKGEGILLKASPYLGNARILKVFTAAEAGLVSLIAKGIERKNWGALTTPFCRAEWVYKKGREELCTLKDATLLDDLSELKKSFHAISAAGAIAQALLSSQFPGKRGGDLYILLHAYLKKLPDAPRPEVLVSSFRLKLLLWEGLLALESLSAPLFSESEWELLIQLAFSRRFSELLSLEITPALEEKIRAIFDERIN